MGGRQVWARGQRDASWRLVPGSQRRSKVLESEVAHMFRLRAPSRHARCPAHDDLAGWLSLMQHYGLATRLLDWSESALVAAFFAAAEGAIECDAAIWLLDPAGLNRSFGVFAIPLLSSPAVKDEVGGAFSWPSSKRILAVHASQIDVRMAVQLSQFTIHGADFALDQHPHADQFLTKLVIPKDALQPFRHELSILGVRRSSLFPDLDNLARELGDLVLIQGDAPTVE